MATREIPSRRKVLDPGLGLLVVGRPDIDHVGQRRVAQEGGAGERPDEGHVRFGRDREGRLRRGRADLADQGEDPVLVDQAPGVRDRPLRLVAVVVGHELEPAPVHAAGGIRFGEGREDALAHAEPQSRRRSREGGRLAERDPVAGDARLGMSDAGHPRLPATPSSNAALRLS